MKKYSDDELLEQMRKFYEKNNRITQRSFTKDKTVCSASSIIYRFGSWENAMEKAGITWKEYVDDIETKREKVRKMVKEYIKKTGKLPVNSEFMSWNGLPSISYVNKLFGNKKKLYNELGYTGKKFGEKLSKEEIIEKIQCFYKQYGREPIQDDFRLKNDLPTWRNIKIYFGTIVEAKKEAGFQLAEKKRVYTKQEAIEALQRFYEREGRYPFKEDMKAKNGLPSLIKLRSLFGTLRAAREAAGMGAIGKKKTYIIKEDLEEVMVEKYRENGRRLTSAEIYKDKELPSPSGIMNTLRIQKLTEAWEYIEKKYKLKN